MVDRYGSCLCRCRHRPHCHTLGFQSITLEMMHQFHSNFIEGSSIIKYKYERGGGGGGGVIPKNLNELWPFFNIYFGSIVELWFQINNF